MSLVWRRLLNIIYNILTWFWILTLLICFIAIWLWVYNDVYPDTKSDFKTVEAQFCYLPIMNKSPRLKEAATSTLLGPFTLGEE